MIDTQRACAGWWWTGGGCQAVISYPPTLSLNGWGAWKNARVPTQRKRGPQSRPSTFINQHKKRTQAGRERRKRRLTSTFQSCSTLPCFILFLSVDSLPFSPHDSIFLLSISTVRPLVSPAAAVPPRGCLLPLNQKETRWRERKEGGKRTTSPDPCA